MGILSKFAFGIESRALFKNSLSIIMSTSFPVLKQFSKELNFIGSGRIDPLLQWFFQSDGQFYFQGQIAIFCLGVSLLSFMFKDDKSFAIQLVGLVSYCLALYALLGRTITLCSVQWFPWVLAAYYFLVSRRESVFSYALFLIFSLLWIYTAGALAFAGILALGFLGIRDRLEKFAIPFGVLLLVVLFMLPSSSSPYYPGDARFFTTDRVVSRPQALVGPHLNLSSVDFVSYQLQLQFTSIFISAFAVISLGGFALRYVRSRLILLSLLVLSVVVCLEYYLLEIGLINTPYLFVSRVVPGLGLFPFLWGILSIVLVVIFSDLFFRQDSRAVCFFACLSLFLFLARVGIFDVELEPLDYNLSSSSATHESKVHWSPSRLVVEREGSWVADKNSFKNRFVGNLQRVSLPQTGLWMATASENNAEALLGLWDSNTSWHTSSSMSPGQWFELRWEKPVSLVKVLLTLPSSDEGRQGFPRGLKLEGFNSQGESFLIRNIKSWNGPVRWTKESFPYYGSLGDVIVDFPKPSEVVGLRFTQTAQAPKALWSISEVKLYGNL